VFKRPPNKLALSRICSERSEGGEEGGMERRTDLTAKSVRRADCTKKKGRALICLGNISPPFITRGKVDGVRASGRGRSGILGGGRR